MATVQTLEGCLAGELSGDWRITSACQITLELQHLNRKETLR